jgi:type II secretory pathway component PulJ
MADDRNLTFVEVAVSAAIPGQMQAARLPLQQGARAFTLAELVVTVGVLALLVFFATQLLNSAATVTTFGHRQMDADAQARQLLDRMTIDFAQMVKRSDVDYYVKSNNTPGSGLRRVLQTGNDQVAFYSAVPGYYPGANYQSPVSLVAYRVNSNSSSSSYNKMERMGKGLLWNAVTPSPAPVVFIPIPLASPLPIGELPSPTPNPLPTPAWPEASSATASWSDSEVIGPQVFRFEYCYQLKDGSFSDVPWITSIHGSPSGMQDVSAIVVDIAVIDPKSKVLLTNAQINTLAGHLSDFRTGRPPGDLRTQWQDTLNANTTLPRPAISGIRLYERFIYLSPPVQ